MGSQKVIFIDNLLTVLRDRLLTNTVAAAAADNDDDDDDDDDDDGDVINDGDTCIAVLRQSAHVEQKIK